MARKIGAIKTFTSLWQDHETLYYSVFNNALEQLILSDKQKNDEDAISEALCPVLSKICFEHEDDIRIPNWEQPIQPVETKDLKGGKANKRPDFSCNLYNSLATNKTMYKIPFHVECKRLGKTIGSPNLNKNYVSEGIKRFDLKSHEYGKKAPSGMMIGYIINMEYADIISIVNKHLPEYLPKLKFNFLSDVVSCEQTMLRNNIEPKKFKLIHLWADLR